MYSPARRCPPLGTHRRTFFVHARGAALLRALCAPRRYDAVARRSRTRGELRVVPRGATPIGARRAERAARTGAKSIDRVNCRS